LKAIILIPEFKLLSKNAGIRILDGIPIFLASPISSKPLGNFKGENSFIAGKIGNQ